MSSSTTARERIDTAIWGRIIKPDKATYSPEAARAILKLDFDVEDHRRMEVLSRKAQDAALSSQEEAELDEYVRVNDVLTLLQSKARLSLKKAGLKS